MSIVHHGIEVTAPATWLQPTEVRHTGPSTEEVLIKGRDIFCLGRDDYEIEYELTLLVHLDNGAVDTLAAKGHTMHCFRPIVAGVELFPDRYIQENLFAKCLETKRGREQLRSLCKTANGEA